MLARCIIISAFSAATALAQAQQPSGPPPGGDRADFAKVRDACRADVDRFCKDVKPGAGRIRECLKTHQADLSEGCRTAIKEARERRRPPG
jgi:Cysteine rich repeat